MICGVDILIFFAHQVCFLTRLRMNVCLRGGERNDPAGHFVYLSLVPLFDAPSLSIYYYVTCGDDWFGFRRVLDSIGTKSS